MALFSQSFATAGANVQDEASLGRDQWAAGPGEIGTFRPSQASVLCTVQTLLSLPVSVQVTPVKTVAALYHLPSLAAPPPPAGLGRFRLN